MRKIGSVYFYGHCIDTDFLLLRSRNEVNMERVEECGEKRVRQLPVNALAVFEMLLLGSILMPGGIGCHGNLPKGLETI